VAPPQFDQILFFHFIPAMVKASDFKFGMQRGFVKFHGKNTVRGKVQECD